MGKATRKRLGILIYCLVVMNLLLAPVAHASMLVFGTDNETVSLHDDCDQEPGAGSGHEPANATHETANMDCEHGINCQLLCSISLSTLNQGAVSVPESEKSNRWLPSGTSELNSSFLSRLERPPRS